MRGGGRLADGPLKAEAKGAGFLPAQISCFAIGFICQLRQSIAYGTVPERIGEPAIMLGVLPEISRIVHLNTPVAPSTITTS